MADHEIHQNFRKTGHKSRRERKSMFSTSKENTEISEKSTNDRESLERYFKNKQCIISECGEILNPSADSPPQKTIPHLRIPVRKALTVDFPEPMPDKKHRNDRYPIKPRQIYYIRNIESDSFLFVSGDFMNGDCIVEARHRVMDRSKFYIIKNSSGYIIGCPMSGKYLFLADTDRLSGDRIVEGGPEVFSKSYFEIIKKGTGYLIKNTKHQEYLFLSNDVKNGDRVVEAKRTIEDRSYFEFTPCPI